MRRKHWSALLFLSVFLLNGSYLGAQESRITPGRRVIYPSFEVDVLVNGTRLGEYESRGRTYVEERAAGRTWRVAGNGFWQVHPGAAETLSRAVLDAVRPRPGERVLDLYGGVGLFAGALADAVGASGQVTTVESDRRASADARRNLHSVPNLRIVQGRVERVVTGEPVDVVVLDPPRTGARRRVVEAIADMSPRAIGYVACDPAALARDVATFITRGYVLSSLRAFAMFPMTHHVECVALLEPG